MWQILVNRAFTFTFMGFTGLLGIVFITFHVPILGTCRKEEEEEEEEEEGNVLRGRPRENSRNQH